MEYNQEITSEQMYWIIDIEIYRICTCGAMFDTISALIMHINDKHLKDKEKKNECI